MTRHPYSAIVGIDPSLTSTGMVRLSMDWCPDEVETFKSNGKKDASWDDRAGRLLTLADRIVSQVPDRSLVLMEAPSYGSVAAKSASQHDRSGLWWGIYWKAQARGCTIIPVAPTVRAKYATGKGNAGKDAVLAAVVKRYPTFNIVGNDTADALVLAAIGARLVGQPIDDLPKTHLAALATLPDLTQSKALTS